MHLLRHGRGLRAQGAHRSAAARSGGRRAHGAAVRLGRAGAPRATQAAVDTARAADVLRPEPHVHPVEDPVRRSGVQPDHRRDPGHAHPGRLHAVLDDDVRAPRGRDRGGAVRAVVVFAKGGLLRFSSLWRAILLFTATGAVLPARHRLGMGGLGARAHLHRADARGHAVLDDAGRRGASFAHVALRHLRLGLDRLLAAVRVGRAGGQSGRAARRGICGAAGVGLPADHRRGVRAQRGELLAAPHLRRFGGPRARTFDVREHRRGLRALGVPAGPHRARSGGAAAVVQGSLEKLHCRKPVHQREHRALPLEAHLRQARRPFEAGYPGPDRAG